MDQRELKITLSAIDNASKVIQDMARKAGTAFDSPSQTLSQRINAVGDKLISVGRGITALTAPIAAFAAYSVKSFIDFEDQMANVRKSVGATADETKVLGDSILDIASKTRTSIKDLTTIAQIGGQMGISKDGIVDFTEAMNKLNVALGDEFSGGAQQVTTAIGGLRAIFKNMQTDSISNDLLHMGNAINVLGMSGLATGEVMANFAQRIGGIGAPLGLTIDQVLGLSATLQELQVAPERGSSAVTRIFQKMGQDIDGFAKIAGVSASQFKKLFNEDINGAFIKVTEGLKNLSPTNLELVLNLKELGLSGVYVSEIVNKLGTNTDMLRDKQKMAGDAMRNITSITNEYNIKNETTAAAVDRLRNNVQILGTKMGEAFAPVINNVLESTSSWLISLTKLDPQTRATAGAIGIFAVALGPIVIGIGTLAKSVSAIMELNAALTVMTGIGLGPWGLALAGIVASLLWIAANYDSVSNGVENIAKKLGLISETSKEAERTLSQLITTSERLPDGTVGLKVGVDPKYYGSPKTIMDKDYDKYMNLTTRDKSKDQLLGSVPQAPGVFGGSGFLGLFADGGRPPVGKPSVVGEQGAEIFVPDGGGTIIPNDKIGGGGVTVNVGINGGMYLDQNSAVMIGDMIIDRLRMQMKVI